MILNTLINKKIYFNIICIPLSSSIQSICFINILFGWFSDLLNGFISIFCPKYTISSHNAVCTMRCSQFCSLLIKTSIHLNIKVGKMGPKLFHFWKYLFHKFLSSKPRLYCHYQYFVNQTLLSIIQKNFRNWSCRLEAYSSLYFMFSYFKK